MVEVLLRVLGGRGVQRRIRKQLKKLSEHLEGQADPGQVDDLSRYTGKIKSLTEDGSVASRAYSGRATSKSCCPSK